MGVGAGAEASVWTLAQALVAQVTGEADPGVLLPPGASVIERIAALRGADRARVLQTMEPRIFAMFGEWH